VHGTLRAKPTAEGGARRLIAASTDAKPACATPNAVELRVFDSGL
jgi:hypothetical protein